MKNLSGFISALQVPPQVNAAVIRGFMNEEEVEDDDQVVIRWKMWINTPLALWVLTVGLWFFQVIHNAVGVFVCLFFVVVFSYLFSQF